MNDIGQMHLTQRTQFRVLLSKLLTADEIKQISKRLRFTFSNPAENDHVKGAITHETHILPQDAQGNDRTPKFLEPFEKQWSALDTIFHIREEPVANPPSSPLSCVAMSRAGSGEDAVGGLSCLPLAQQRASSDTGPSTVADTGSSAAADVGLPSIPLVHCWDAVDGDSLLPTLSDEQCLGASLFSTLL